MSRSGLEVADIFRHSGAAYRHDHAGHLSRGQLKVMEAIEDCRTAALGGHVDACEACGHLRISYNSCGNRHCPKCQGVAAQAWLEEQAAALLPVPYYHVVFTMPSQLNAVAYQNKAVVYDIQFKAAAETLLTIGADPEHLGAKLGFTAVLHTWGSAMTLHPHIHVIVPGGGIAIDGERWVDCRKRFFLPVNVLAMLYRRLFLEKLVAAFEAGKLSFFDEAAGLAEADAFQRYLAPLRKIKWHVYAKRPFAGPEAVLRYLSRYTHRIAISNTRLVAFDGERVTFRYKDYRVDGKARVKLMTLAVDEFIRRFLLHVVPDGFHRIRHYGMLANGNRAKCLPKARELLGVRAMLPTSIDAVLAANRQDEESGDQIDPVVPPCPCCGGRMIVIERFDKGCLPRHQPSPPPKRDTS
jgi:hypothetical protein